MKFFGAKIQPSILLLTVSGVLLLVSLQFLAQGVLALWLTAKAIFAAGVMLFLFDR